MRSSELASWRDSRLADRGVIHGVTGRAAGDMKEEAARAGALAAAGLETRVPFRLKQVHGTEILPAAGAAAPLSAPEGDGWVTDRPEPVLCVFVADCMPLFAADEKGRAVGVFHSGWRGTAAGLPGRIPAAFQRYGVSPASLYVSVGPHIRSCCYRVGRELEGRLRPASLLRRGGELFADLAAEALAQLVEAGVPAGSVAVEGPCTSCGEGFFSFRRDKTGARMMAYAARRNDA